MRRVRQRLYDLRLVPTARWTLLLIGLVFPFWLSDDRPPPWSPVVRTALLVGDHAFSLVDWERRVLSQRLREAWPGQPTASAKDTTLVYRYFDVVDHLNGLIAREGQLVAAGRAAGDPELAAVRSDITSIQAQRRALEPAARAVLEAQVSAAIRDLDLGGELIEFERTDSFPPVAVRITPAVFFSFANLPLALTIGPRDRIAVSHSQLLEPALPPAEQAALEDSLDSALNVASIVVPIGGFATYPSMIPATAGLSESLNTIAHEWVHHYLAVRPLGWNYFASYDMRSINETIADIAGQEIAAQVWETYYATGEGAAESRPAPRTDPFTAEMRRIRQETEKLLQTGDLEAVARYLEAERLGLVAKGYHLRKLNTTYLAFFGSYSGSGNVWESGLRDLRERSESLADFVRMVSAAGNPDEVRQLFTRAKPPAA